MDANLRPTEEKWMLRTSEILVGSLVYLLRTDSGSDQGLEFFLVRLVRFISIGNSTICSDIWHKYHE